MVKHMIVWKLKDDIENKEVEQFIVDALRISEFRDVFLYYFVDYYKKYEEELAAAEKEWQKGFVEEIKDKDLTIEQRSIAWTHYRQMAFNKWNRRVGKDGKIDYRYKRQNVEIIE